MISMSFDGVSFDCWQEPDLNYSVPCKETTLYSGETHVTLGTTSKSFPRSYLCYTSSFTTITNLIAKMGTFGTLVYNGVSFLDCYITPDSGISSIKEIVRGSGKWTFIIKFGQADQY